MNQQRCRDSKNGLIVMSADTTLDYYNNNTGNFIEGTISVDLGEIYGIFLSYIPDGGKILDLGCGSGRDTKHFIEAGYDVTAVDGSRTLCDEATKYTGIEVRCMRFDELNEISIYDGVFACASLLHVPAEELPGIICKIRDSIKPGGILYASFKYGDYEGERDGRYFHDMNEESVTELFSLIDGLDIDRMWQSHDVRRDKDAYWINVIAIRE